MKKFPEFKITGKQFFCCSGNEQKYTGEFCKKACCLFRPLQRFLADLYGLLSGEFL